MGRKKKKKKLTIKQKEQLKPLQREEVLTFGKKNYSVFAAALVSIIVGFLLLSKGSITAAPILLVLGYVILVPLSIIIK
jgi:hypothetical protein